MPITKRDSAFMVSAQVPDEGRAAIRAVRASSFGASSLGKFSAMTAMASFSHARW